MVYYRMFNKKKGEKNMNTKNEIKKIENKIKSLEAYCDANCEKDLKGKELTKLSNSIESLVFNQDKLKELKSKLKYEENLSKEISEINKSLNMKVVSRETNYDCWEREFLNGFYPEKIEIMYEDKVVPLTFMSDGFYISYKDHGGMAIFNPYNDIVKSNHKFYTKERA
jgi:hypothetical protein